MGDTASLRRSILFVHMAYTYIKEVGELSILSEKINGFSLIDRLALAFQVPPAEPIDHLVFASEKFRGVDFGFRDAIHMTGKLLFPSLLKFRAAKELAELYSLMGNAKERLKYERIATKIKEAIPVVFNDESGF